MLFIARIAVPTLITICLSCCLDYAFALNAKTTFSHVTVLATNMTASLDFYHKIGFAIDKSRPEMGFDGVWLHIPTSDTTASHISIHLVQTERSAGRTLNQSVSIYGSEHFAISLQGRMNKIIEELRKLNIPLCLGAPRPNDFVDQTFVSDPDGNLIEISTQDDNYITITALEASLRHTSKDSPAYSSTVSKLERLYAIVTDQLVLDFREGLAKYGSFKTMSDKNLRPSKTSLSTGTRIIGVLDIVHLVCNRSG